MNVDFHERVTSCLWALFITYITAIDASLEEVERHLDLGKQFLSKGQFADALTHYHAAVDLDPENYLTRYRRATALLALGKSKSAMPDLDKVIELKPDFYAARLQRGNVLLKQGEWGSAYADFENVLANEPSNTEAQAKLDAIGPAQENIANADQLAASGDVYSAENLYTSVLDVSPWNAQVHEKRADCYEAMGDIRKAIGDVRSVTKLVADSKEMLYRLSKLHYSLGEVEESLSQIRECLKLDPDDKECFPHYKKVKKMAKTLGDMHAAMEREDYGECVAKAQRVLDSETRVPALKRLMNTHLCKCYSKGGGEPSQAIEACTIALDGGDDPDVLCDRADAHLNNDEYDEAIQDFQAALKVDENYHRAKEGQQRAQKLHKQSQKRDYYKILGVKRNARKNEILKAYRKLAQKWHPDKYPEEDKKMAEKKFMDIAAAKEVLTDSEKRAKFDAGEDPLDASSQQGGWQHPFFGGFDPFGGGGGHFHFKFDFN